MFGKSNFVQSPPVPRPPHADYERNFAYAKKFASDRETLFPTGMKMRFEKTNHDKPRHILLISYRRHRDFAVPCFSNYVRLDDDIASECQKNIRVTYETYVILAEKYNEKCNALGIKDPYEYALSA